MKMQNAEMEFVAFDAKDVIATSTITLSGFGNGVTGDERIEGTYNSGDVLLRHGYEYSEYLSEFLGSPQYFWRNSPVYIDDILATGDTDTSNANLNGVYRYVPWEDMAGNTGYRWENIEEGFYNLQ